MSELTAFLERRYASADGRWAGTVTEIERRWAAFRPFADANFVQEFCTDAPEVFQQRFWELYLGAMLLDQGLQLRPTDGHGPDLCFESAGRVVWVEAISPGPGRGADRVPELEFIEIEQLAGSPGQEVPARQTVLRYTTAIEAKMAQYRAHREAGIVGEHDPYVIAVDASQLGLWGFHGISTFPGVLEAVFPMGAMQAHFPVGRPGEPVTTSIQHRPVVQKANEAEIPTTRFLDPAYAGISGVLCSDRSDGVRTPPTPMIFAHNKVAANPLRPLPIRVNDEYHVEDAPSGFVLRTTHHSDP